MAASACVWCCCEQVALVTLLCLLAAGIKCEELSRRLAEAERRGQDAEARATAAQQVRYSTACLPACRPIAVQSDVRPEHVPHRSARGLVHCFLPTETCCGIGQAPCQPSCDVLLWLVGQMLGGSYRYTRHCLTPHTYPEPCVGTLLPCHSSLKCAAVVGWCLSVTVLNTHVPWVLHAGAGGAASAGGQADGGGGGHGGSGTNTGEDGRGGGWGPARPPLGID